MSSTPLECPACGSISKTGSDVCEMCGFMLPKTPDAPARVEARPAPAAPPLEDDFIELPLEAEVKVKKPHIVPSPVRNVSPPPRPQAAAAAEAQKADAQRQQPPPALKQQQAAKANVPAQKNEAKVKPAAAQAATGTASGVMTVQLLKKYEGQTIGINYNNSADIREAELSHVNSDYFTVLVKEKKLRFTFPLRTLLSVVEGEDGVETVVGGTATKMKVVLKVYPLVLF
jgi:hypothetical protein